MKNRSHLFVRLRVTLLLSKYFRKFLSSQPPMSPLNRSFGNRTFPRTAGQGSACALGLLTLVGCGRGLGVSDTQVEHHRPQNLARSARNYRASAQAGLNCGRSGVDVARAVTDAARVVALLCESQNVQMAKDGFRRCPTEMCFFESTITDPDNPVLTVTINYTDDLGSGGGGGGAPGGGSGFPPIGGTSPQRLTVGVSLTIPLGGPRSTTKCISPIHPSIFTDIQKQTIEEIRNAKPEFCG